VTRLGPDSLAGRLVLVVLVALVLGQGLSFLIFADERRAIFRAANREQVLSRTATLVRLLEETPPGLQGPILAASSSRQLRFELDGDSAIDADDADHARNRLARTLSEFLDGNGGRPVLVDIRDERGRLENLVGFKPLDEATGRPRYWRAQRGGLGLVVSVALGDGRWLNAQTSFPTPPAWALPNLVSLGLTAGLAGLAVVVAVRRLARPLARLAAAADALGRGEASPPLPEEGPADLKSTVHAFNRMQARLKRFVDDRTAMLAAVSHDLRTPITSLRLRAEFVEDEETRERMLETLDEMQRMVEVTLTFAREEATSEETRVVDLAALVESITADLADLGADVACASPGRLPYPCRPLALRRAVRNLIENAVRYGTRARVGLESDREGIRILVDDDGPGIPPEEMERAFEPFVRLEGSRSRETGGIGLGLAIARSIARSHGGDVRLANRPEGGLRATLALPRA
jgi:signal transduction histidine kinase